MTLSKEPWPDGFRSYEVKTGLLLSRFNELSVPMDFGPGCGVRPVNILPFMSRYLNDMDMKIGVRIFFRNTSFHLGEVRIGDKTLQAVLAQADSITGRFDLPHTNLYLTVPENKEQYEYWSGSDYLCTYRCIDGKYFTIDTTPLGDKLFVKPYTGDIGTIRPGPGAGHQGNDYFRFVVFARTHGGHRSNRRCESWPAAEWKVPAGDYTFDYTGLQYGLLRIRLCGNYHSDGKRQDWNRQLKYAVQIRKDKPFVLDFSNKPEVLFAAPAKNSVFKPGDEVQVYAVLVDPVLDIMISNLDDTRQKIKEEIDMGGGKKETREKNKSLDPTVTIADSAGKIVAEGPMPFG